MTEFINDVLVIESEPEGVCEFCHKVAETRPYGPNYEEICFECGMKNRKVAFEKFHEFLNGNAPPRKARQIN